MWCLKSELSKGLRDNDVSKGLRDNDVSKYRDRLINQGHRFFSHSAEGIQGAAVNNNLPRCYPTLVQ